MIKKIFLSIFLLVICISTNSALANEKLEIKYNNIKPNSKITLVNNGTVWTRNIPSKDTGYFIKRTSEDIDSNSEYYSKNGELIFILDSQYEFIHDGNLIGYVNNELKFYEYNYINEELFKRELSFDEVKELFPKRKIIKISNFSKTTNSIKIKKKCADLKLLIYNDTDNTYEDYYFSTNNSDFNLYKLNGFIDVKDKGMIQFAKKSDEKSNTPWYIILVR